MNAGRAMHLVVEARGEGGEALNRHLEAFLRLAAEDGADLRVTLCAAEGAADPARAGVAELCRGREVTMLEGSVLPENADAYFPHPGGDRDAILVALTRGMKVLQHGTELDLAGDYRDFRQGYLLNKDAEWYAKLFPEPVHIADPSKLSLGLGVTVNPRAIILNAGIDGVGGMVTVGRASHIGADTLLNLGPTDFSVGNFSMISANFSAHAMRHAMSHVSNFAITKGPFRFFGSGYDKAEAIRIGHDVWIGERVTCLPGVEFANGCVVGAGSVVTRPLEPYGVYAGNPARLLRHRFEPEKIALLDGLRWWDFEFDRLKDLRDAFARDIKELSLEELRALF